MSISTDIPVDIWTHQGLPAITDTPGSRGFIKKHNYRDIQADCAVVIVAAGVNGFVASISKN